MQLLTCLAASPLPPKRRGPKESGAACSGPQPARPQISDGNRRFPTRARKLNERKQGVPSDEELERKFSILKKAAKQRQGGVQTPLPFPQDIRYKSGILTIQPSSLIHNTPYLSRPQSGVKCYCFRESLLRLWAFGKTMLICIHPF